MLGRCEMNLTWEWIWVYILKFDLHFKVALPVCCATVIPSHLSNVLLAQHKNFSYSLHPDICAEAPPFRLLIDIPTTNAPPLLGINEDIWIYITRTKYPFILFVPDLTFKHKCCVFLTCRQSIVYSVHTMTTFHSINLDSLWCQCFRSYPKSIFPHNHHESLSGRPIWGHTEHTSLNPTIGTSEFRVFSFSSLYCSLTFPIVFCPHPALRQDWRESLSGGWCGLMCQSCASVSARCTFITWLWKWIQM